MLAACMLAMVTVSCSNDDNYVGGTHGTET